MLDIDVKAGWGKMFCFTQGHEACSAGLVCELIPAAVERAVSRPHSPARSAQRGMGSCALQRLPARSWLLPSPCLNRICQIFKSFQIPSCKQKIKSRLTFCGNKSLLRHFIVFSALPCDRLQLFLMLRFQEVQQEISQRLTISDFLIKPIQRITKYQLLLKVSSKIQLD